MYERHFGLDQRPFSIAPDPRFLYLSGRHREALAHLVYGLGDDGGFVLVTGEVGTGKTTLCRCLLQQVPAHTDVAFVLNPRVSELELLQTICDELRIAAAAPDSIKSLVDAINAHLLATHAAGRNTVVIVDEAQNLAPAVLEQLRLLTNLETSERKLLRIILLGQPELRAVLATPGLRQLAQRITARYHLSVLRREETHQYVAHRLGVAGGAVDVFTRGAVDRLHTLAGGVPRRINIIADRAMLGAYALGTRRVTRAIVTRAAREVAGAGELPRRSWPAGLAGAAAAGALAMALGLLLWQTWPWAPASPTQGAAPVTPPRADHARGDEATASAHGAAAADLAGAAAGPLPADAAGAAPGTAGAAASVPGREYGAFTGSPAQRGPAVDGTSEAPAHAEADVITPDSALGAAAAAIAAGTSDNASGRDTAAPLATADTVSTSTTAAAVTWPQPVPREQSQAYALSALFSRWGTPFAPPAGADLCEYATRSGLGCLEREGNWRLLRDIDRPAMLWLTDAPGPAAAGADAGGQPFWAALLGIDANDVGVLDVGGSRQRVPLAAIDAQWRGRFVVLWGLPPGYVVPAALGSRGADVAHLRERLAAISGRPIAGTPDAFDAALADALRAFQQRMGIDPDGVAGPNTWIAIDSLTGDVPRLQAAGAGEPVTAGAQES
jgi:general secretion pathway protein A